VVPIIENTARECELTASLREAMRNYPKANAVLVKRHGVYVWGDNWIQAKTQAECYEYLFEAAVKLKGIGIDVSQAPPRGPAEIGKHRSAISLDLLSRSHCERFVWFSNSRNLL